jgi:hypothetical protein
MSNKNPEMESHKPPASMDEILQARLDPVIDEINKHVENIYKEFNIALHKQHMNLVGVEKEITNMTQVLWGIVNKTNVRAAALERLLIKNGLSEEAFADEIIAAEEELMKTGEWKSLDLANVAKEIGLDLSKRQTDQALA